MITEWYSGLSPATIPAWSGLIISIALALIKIVELWWGRFKVDASLTLTSDDEIGNILYIRNLSPNPIILTHWRIYYARRFWPFAEKTKAAEAEFDWGDTTIDRISTETMHFREAEYFPSSHKFLRGRAIYIRMSFAGRRGVTRRLYPR